MKYIYYIISIMIVFSGLALYGLFHTEVKISKPFLSINDKVISKAEFDRMLEKKPVDISRKQFIEAMIDRQLLIQEAIKMKINREEKFRRSVQEFYEQSLIKTLLDRKFNSLKIKVKKEEIATYEFLTGTRLLLTRTAYPTIKDAQNRTNGKIKKIDADFIDMSDKLKFIVMHLKKGGLSAPICTASGIVMYRLDDIKKIKGSTKLKQFDIKRISLFIRNEKKAALMKKWTDKIREKAIIWRENG